LESDCVDGKKSKVKVILTGPGLGLGATDITLSQSSVKLKDSLPFVNPIVFNNSSLNGGFFASASFSPGQTSQSRLGQTPVGGSGKDDGYGAAAISFGDVGGMGSVTFPLRAPEKTLAVLGPEPDLHQKPHRDSRRLMLLTTWK